MEYYLDSLHTNSHKQAIKKEGNPTIYDKMDEPRGYYAKLNSQTQEDKYFMISLIGGI